MNPDYCWLDGRIVPWADSSIHVSTEAVLRGASVFEGIRAYRSQDGELLAFRMGDHLRRMFDTSLRFLRLDSPYSVEQLSTAVVELIQANGQQADVYIRVVVCVSELNLGRELEAGTGAFIITQELYPAKPEMRVTLSPGRRLPPIAAPVESVRTSLSVPRLAPGAEVRAAVHNHRADTWIGVRLVHRTDQLQRGRRSQGVTPVRSGQRDDRHIVGDPIVDVSYGERSHC